MVATNQDREAQGKALVAESAKVRDAVCETLTELESAMAAYPRMPTFHDGYAVILEELDELWEEVRKKPYARSSHRMRHEAMQVAAMALRFMADLTGSGEP